MSDDARLIFSRENATLSAEPGTLSGSILLGDNETTSLGIEDEVISGEHHF